MVLGIDMRGGVDVVHHDRTGDLDRGRTGTAARDTRAVDVVGADRDDDQAAAERRFGSAFEIVLNVAKIQRIR